MEAPDASGALPAALAVSDVPPLLPAAAPADAVTEQPRAGKLDKRPALRALEKVVSEEGLKTVVTLRLAPVLPIPLGAYNYGAY